MSRGTSFFMIVAMALLTTLAAACGNLTGAAPPPPRTAATAVPSATTSGTRSAAAGSAQECAATELTVTTGTSGVGMGHAALVLLFTNSSSVPCFTQGYPGVALQLADGVYNAERTMTGYMGGDAAPAPARVQLQPGATASALIEWIHFPADGNASVTTADCTGYAAVLMLVTAPDQTSSTKLAAPVPGSPVCSGFEVHPIVPGSAGQFPPAS